MAVHAPQNGEVRDRYRNRRSSWLVGKIGRSRNRRLL